MLWLEVFYCGGFIVVEVVDDGVGLNCDVIVVKVI